MRVFAAVLLCSLACSFAKHAEEITGKVEDKSLVSRCPPKTCIPDGFHTFILDCCCSGHWYWERCGRADCLTCGGYSEQGVSADPLATHQNSRALPTWLSLAGLGFLEGFTQTSDLHECIKAAMVPSGEIKDGILDIKKGLQEHNVTELQGGIDLLFKVMDDLPTMMQGCKMEGEDVEAIVKVLKGFHSLKDILARVEADMKADDEGELAQEFELMVHSFTEKQYEEFGKHAGKAWHLLFIGSSALPGNDNVILGATGGTLKVSWSSCDAASTHGKVTSVEPGFLTLGAKTTVVGSGSVDESVTAASATVSVKAGFFRKTVNFPDACAARTISTPIGSLTFQGITCPLAAGPISVKTDIQLSGAIPAFLARASINLKVTAANGDELVCMDVKTAPASKTESIMV